MSSRNVSFNRLAIEEYRDARFWYADRSPAALENYIAAVDAAVMRIVREYELLPKLSPKSKYRYVRVEKYPHILIFYERADQHVRIVAAAHTSRRRGYWRRRV